MPGFIGYHDRFSTFPSSTGHEWRTDLKPTAARSRIPLGVDGRGWPTNQPGRCIGPLKIIKWTLADDGLLSIDLVKIGESPRVSTNYVVFANLVEGRWLFSWPADAGAGIPLHPTMDPKSRGRFQSGQDASDQIEHR